MIRSLAILQSRTVEQHRRGALSAMTDDEVEIEVAVASTAVLKLMWLTGLAKGKLNVEMPKPMRVGTAARVRIVLPSQRIELRGVVSGCAAHPRGYSVGVKISDIASNAALMSLVR
jgi:hypothetical protein